MIIEYYSKNVYGSEMRYIKDKNLSSKIQFLTGRKTITDRDIVALKDLGFELKEVLQNN